MMAFRKMGPHLPPISPPAAPPPKKKEEEVHLPGPSIFPTGSLNRHLSPSLALVSSLNLEESPPLVIRRRAELR